MSNEIDKLKQAFDDEPLPTPDESTRNIAIAAAMRAFEEENLNPSKGSERPARLKNTHQSVFTLIFWRRAMNTINQHLKPYLLGGASLTLLAVAVLNTQYLQNKLPLSNEEWLSESAEVRLPAPVKLTTDASQAREPAIDSETYKQYAASPDLAQSGERAAQQNSEIPANREVGEPKRDLATQITGLDNVRSEQSRLDLADRSSRKIQAPRAQSEPSPEPAMDLILDSIDEYDGMESVPERTVQPNAKSPSVAGAYMQGKKDVRPDIDGRVRALHIPESESMNSRIASMSDSAAVQNYRDQGRDKFSDIKPNATKLVAEDPISTFSIDVDTASYAFTRASLNKNVLPQSDAVRIEEMINYFPYDYAPPQHKSEPFRTHVSVLRTPWNSATKLMHIGIQGYELPLAATPHANLVFLIDSSGSMNANNKLPLLRNSFKLLLSTLRADDTIAIVTYAGSAGTVLEPTPVRDKSKIIAALDGLRSGGSTAGAEGIRQAYQLAEQNFDSSGVNRVILATDGDFNVGITNQQELKSFIERKRESGIFLSVLGLGMGNYNDELMQTLAQNGNGNAAYIDSLSEARKVLVEEAASTLFTIAKDVKIQVEFNPQTVSEYRLIGYETRTLNREDFNNDKIDAGDIGAGHSVTAIYEITPVNSTNKLIDELRYQAAPQSNATNTDEYAFLKLRYKLPDSDTSTLITTPVTRSSETSTVKSAPRETQFATAVAAFGQLLRGGRYTGSYSFDDVISLAQGSKGQDPFGYRAEFINLVRLAKSAAGLSPLQR
ncbi:MAG: Ca-activated chloride channel family protein [Gammaproteobacteria bacterium]|jgi:Ca-activated chloride channel family protein